MYFDCFVGIDQFKDDWMKVAEYVNKEYHNGESVRTHDECIAAFVRMPIEDPYLDPDNTVGQSCADDVPFASFRNPLFATLSFLVQHVGEGVAAAGAQGALKAIETLRPQAPSAGASPSTSVPTTPAAAAAGTTAAAPQPPVNSEDTTTGAASTAANAMDVDTDSASPATTAGAGAASATPSAATSTADTMDVSSDGAPATAATLHGDAKPDTTAAPPVTVPPTTAAQPATTAASEAFAAEMAAKEAKFVRQKLSSEKVL